MIPPDYTTRSTCRICNSSRLAFLWNFGNHYISNFVDRGEVLTQPMCPIELYYCETCSLVQNIHTAPQELLYSGHYWYKSSTTSTMKTALTNVYHSVKPFMRTTRPNVVLDIGSNDGTLLHCFPVEDVRVGVEPATNMGKYYQNGKVSLIQGFWGDPLVSELFERTHGKADIITACGMFYDLDNPNDFIREVSKCLAPNGVFVAQLMCLANMINVCDVGNVAHEHLEFYTLRSLDVLLGAHGLSIFKIEVNEVNGQSYRLFIRHNTNFVVTQQLIDPISLRFYEQESDIRNRTMEFLERAELLRKRIVSFVQSVTNKGKTVHVYGASTKGNTILQWLGEPVTSRITCAAEKDSTKWGKYTAGTGIPIVSEEKSRQALPDYYLVLPYAFIDEFIKREELAPWRVRGGKFICPLPTLELL